MTSHIFYKFLIVEVGGTDWANCIGVLNGFWEIDSWRVGCVVGQQQHVPMQHVLIHWSSEIALILGVSRITNM